MCDASCGNLPTAEFVRFDVSAWLALSEHLSWSKTRQLSKCVWVEVIPLEREVNFNFVGHKLERANSE